MQYRRDYTQGASYFFTVVTFRRVGFFNADEAVSRLRSAFKEEIARRPFVIDAIVTTRPHSQCMDIATSGCRLFDAVAEY